MCSIRNVLLSWILVVVHATAERSPVVSTPLGKVYGREEIFGFTGQKLDVFNGVPYAVVSYPIFTSYVILRILPDKPKL